MSGQALYDALLPVMMENSSEKNFQIEAITTHYDGTKVKSLTTMQGLKMRIDTYNPEGVGVYIYSEEEGITYMYDEATKEGIMMKDNEEGDIYEDETAYDEEMSEVVASAELVEFLNRPALYVLFRMEDSDVISESEVWIDLELGFTVKSVIHQNGSIVMEQVTTKIDTNYKGDDAMFTPPDDIVMTDYSLDSMFDGMLEGLEDEGGDN